MTAGSASEPPSLPDVSFPEDSTCRGSVRVSGIIPRKHSRGLQKDTAMYRDSLERVPTPSPEHRLPKQLRR